MKWPNGRTVRWPPSTTGSTLPTAGLHRGRRPHHSDGLGPSEGDTLGGCPGAVPVARAVETAWTPQLSGVTRQLTAQQLPGGGGPWGQAEVWGSWASSSQPHSQALIHKHSFPDHTLAQNSQPISHPSAAAPRNSSPPLTPSHTFLSWDSSSPSVCPLSPLPSSPALVALPVSCCPPALHLCLSEPQVINFLSPGLASSHLYPVRTHWKDRLSPRPCFPQEPTMHYRQGIHTLLSASLS